LIFSRLKTEVVGDEVVQKAGFQENEEPEEGTITRIWGRMKRG
jgi:hypothetical protein